MDYSRTLGIAFAVVVTVVVGGCTSTVVTAPAPGTDGGASGGGLDDGGVDDLGAGDAGACIAAGGNCRGTTNGCCNGTTCVFDATDTSKAICAATCLKDSQCNSGCCKVLIEGTEAVCAPVKYCAGSCSTPGQDCRTHACCANATCVQSTVTGTSCAARCAVGSQCQSGCCAPLDNTGELVCSPATFCR